MIPGSGALVEDEPAAAIVKLGLASPRVRLGVLAALLAGVSVWLLVAGGPSGGDLQRVVDRVGWFGPVLFVAVYIGWTVVLLPAVVPTLAGGRCSGSPLAACSH